MNPELPYTPRGGNSPDTILHNRIAVIERIKHLSGIDLREKNWEFLLMLDMEMFKKFYEGLSKEEMNQPPDELWCQRAAEIVKVLEETEKEWSIRDVKREADEMFVKYQRGEKLAKALNNHIPTHGYSTINPEIKKNKTFWEKVQDWWVNASKHA